MKSGVRVFLMLVWLGAIAIVGLILLLVAASRVGEHKSSTYGEAYQWFQDSWGGEIGIVPPKFMLERTYTSKAYNNSTRRFEVVSKTQQIPLVPQSVDIDSNVNYELQNKRYLTFNAFEVRNNETYIVDNTTPYSGTLVAGFYKPDNANLMRDYQVSLLGTRNKVVRPILGSVSVLEPGMKPGQQAGVVVNYATKGMDIFKYNLSAYENNVIGRLQARIYLNTNDYQVYRFGLPHKIKKTPRGTALLFDINNFSTSQDLGVAFETKQMYLDNIQAMLQYSPLALVFYIFAVFIFAQVKGSRFNALHYLFIAAINVFYFLFVAYLIRFFGVAATLGISAGLAVVMFLAYCPRVLGIRMALVSAIYFVLLTIGFSLIFLMPIFRGLMLVGLLFSIFLSIMVAVSRSDISAWHIVRGDAA